MYLAVNPDFLYLSQFKQLNQDIYQPFALYTLQEKLWTMDCYLLGCDILKNNGVSEKLAAYNFRVEDYKFRTRDALESAHPSTCVILASNPIRTRHWTATYSGHLRLPTCWFLLSEEKSVQMFKGVGMYEVC
jgi:hypothetical protein